MPDPLHGFPEYEDGAPPSLSDFRRLGALAHNLRTPDAADGAMDAGESGFAYTPPPDTSLWARLTAAGTGTYLGKYSWKQVQSDGVGGVVDAPGGMVGAFDGSTGPPAVEVMLGSGLTVGASTGQVVKMWLAESGDHYWFREAPPPAGLTTKDDTTATVTVSPTATLILEAKAKGGAVATNPSTGVFKWTLPQQYVCALYRRQVSLQSVPNSTLTAVSWDTKVIDTGGTASFGAVPLTTLTCPGITGWPNPSDLPCHVNAQVVFAANGAGTRYAEILLSGGAPLAAQSVPACATGPTVLNLSFLAPFTFGTGGAQVLVNVWQDSGGALNVGTLSGTAFGTGNLDTRISLAPHQMVASS